MVAFHATWIAIWRGCWQLFGLRGSPMLVFYAFIVTRCEMVAVEVVAVA
jgi:hypothetical protein